MGTQGFYGLLTYDELHDLCRTRGYARTTSKAELTTRLPATDVVDRKRNCGLADAMVTSETLAGTSNRAMTDAIDTSDELPVTLERRGTPMHPTT